MFTFLLIIQTLVAAMLVAFSVAPSGAGDSVSEAVADAVRVVRASGLPNRTDAMFTTIEGEWDRGSRFVSARRLRRGGRCLAASRAGKRGIDRRCLAGHTRGRGEHDREDNEQAAKDRG